MIRWLVCLLLVPTAAYGQGPPADDRSLPERPSVQEEPVPGSEVGSVGAEKAEESEEDAAARRRAALRSVAGLMVLVLILVAVVLILMILSARRTRLRFSENGRPQPTTLEDLWWTVKEGTVPEVDIEEIMAENDEESTDREQEESGEPTDDDR